MSRLSRILTVCFISILTPYVASSQTNMTDDGVCRWETGAMAGLNNDGYEWQFHGAYFPIQYVGAKIGLGMAGEIHQMGDWGEDEWETGHHYAARFKFNAAIAVRSPRIINWKSQGAGFYLFTEPGIVLSPGASGSRNPRYCCWDLKSGINLQIDHLILTLGYGISDFSLYSGYPTNMQGLPDDDNYITHTAFVSCSYKF